MLQFKLFIHIGKYLASAGDGEYTAILRASNIIKFLYVLQTMCCLFGVKIWGVRVRGTIYSQTL